jgi:MFS family permease
VVSDNLWLLVIAAMLGSAFANTTQGAWQALIPDHVPEAQHGTAAGIKTLLELIGAVAGVVVAGVTIARGNLWGSPLTAVGLFFVILLVTLLTVRQSPHMTKRVDLNPPKSSFSFLTLDFSQMPPSFPWWMLNRFLFWSAGIALRTFLLNYMEDVLSLSLAEAEALSNRLFIVLGLGVFLLALPAGAIADRIGRRPLLMVAGLMAASGAVLFVFLRNLNLLFIAGGLIAGGAGIFASASWALVTDLVPRSEGAQYLALANAATVLGSIGGRLGGALIDGINQLTGTLNFGYLVVFGIAALFFAGSSSVVLKIPEKLSQSARH